jgi:hypothetical protein
MTCRPHGARPEVKGAQGPATRPDHLADRPHFESVQAETWGHVHTSVHKSIPCPRVDGKREEGPPDHP